MNLKGYTYALRGAQQELKEAEDEFKQKEEELHKLNQETLKDLRSDCISLRQELRDSGLCPHEHVYENTSYDYHNNVEDVYYECELCGKTFGEFDRPEGSTIVVKAGK